MAPAKIIDTHIHLWPGTSVSPRDLSWMTEGHFLQKRHGIADYLIAVSASSIQPSGFIYVETDRYLPTPEPDISEEEIRRSFDCIEMRKTVEGKLEKWGHATFEETRFLRRIVEGQPQAGDGFSPDDNGKIVSAVMWAPFHLPSELFDLYLEMAMRISGPLLWAKTAGFRYLIQGIQDDTTMRRLIESPHWLHNLLSLRNGREGRGWTFDIGIDTHRGGVWQLQAAADMVEKVREMEGDEQIGHVKFVLNHLCKPDFSGSATKMQSHWFDTLRRLARQPDVYMKLSGGLNEFEPEPTPSDVETLVSRIRPLVVEVVKMFGPNRVMFGSDWPVCNVGGPKGEGGNWSFWKDCVQSLLELEKFDEEQQAQIWWKTGIEAYGIDP